MMHTEQSSLSARGPGRASPLFQPQSAAELSAPTAGGGPQRRGQPFRDAEACIFWTITTLAAGAEPGTGQDPRRKRRRPTTAVCTPGEVVKCLDTLYRRRRIDLHHVRILRIWGHRGRAPNAELPAERGDWRVWREALDRLDWPLRSLGIIS